MKHEIFLAVTILWMWVVALIEFHLSWYSHKIERWRLSLHDMYMDSYVRTIITILMHKLLY